MMNSKEDSLKDYSKIKLLADNKLPFILITERRFDK